MNRILLYGLCVMTLSVMPAMAQPTFQYGFEGPWRVHGEAETTGAHDYVATISTMGLEGDVAGAQAWVLSVVEDGLRIVEWSYAGTVSAASGDTLSAASGLRSDGFENTQLADDGADARGLISAIVLSYRDPVTLPHDGPQRVLALRVEADYPADGIPCRSGYLRFVDGLQGTGSPQRNVVTYAGSSIAPATADIETQICPAGAFAFAIAGELETTVAPGAPVATLAPYVELRTDLDGVQGWSVSVESRGDCDMVDVTSDGTIGGEADDDDPSNPGLRDAGFEKTELALAERNALRVGAVSAVVLSFTQPVTVPVGRHNILNLSVECDTDGAVDGDTRSHALFFPANNGNPPESGQLRGSGQPVKSAVTFDGNTVEPDIDDAALSVLVREPQIASFRRCDPNNDGRYNIADAIWLVNELFRNGTETQCRDAGDCNDDELLDLSDAVFSIDYQFNGGSEPPAPFPDCGLDDDVTEDHCPAGSTSCP